MIRVWTTGALWQARLRAPPRRRFLVLCLALFGRHGANLAFCDSSPEKLSASALQVDVHASSASENSVPLPWSEYDDQKGRNDSLFSEAFQGSQQKPGDIVFTGGREKQGVIMIHTKEEAGPHERRPGTSRRNLRLGEPADSMQAGAQSHVGSSIQGSNRPSPVLVEIGDRRKEGNRTPPVAPFAWEETGEAFTERLLAASPLINLNRQEGSAEEDAENEEAPTFEESAGMRKITERQSSFGVLGEGFSIPSPLAHSLLYRTRDSSNPLNFANFLAEGQEWLIPGAGSLWEGLGRRVDNIFSGLFLRTAKVLPDYTRNVIICYREYKPSMWIEMLGMRNQFLRQLASFFQGTHRMQSVYLRNLGMEIFEVPPLWRVGEFVATVLKLRNFVSHVYTDHLVTDFDKEVQAPLYGKRVLGDFPSDSEGSSGSGSQQESGAEYWDRNWKVATGDRRESLKSTPRRRLEVMTNDPFTWQQWAIVDSGPSRWGIEAPNAWELWTGQGLKPRFTVAVIDSGVDYEHPDLKNQIWRNPDEICGNGIDDDFNGFVDDCIGWVRLHTTAASKPNMLPQRTRQCAADSSRLSPSISPTEPIGAYTCVQDFVKGTSLPMDENGHGTASAGIIAAEPNNGIGLTGVCWGCDILVLKALNEEIKGTISAFARSLDYAIGKGVVLSNNSYGGRGSGFKGLEEAVQRARQAGMIVVAAAGNYNGNNDNDKQPVFPASYELDNVVSVAAISRNGQLAPFSSYGKKQVDVAAPGANIMTTSAQKSYRTVSGTSFAVPMVTGTLALLWTRRPHLNYRQVIQRLLRSVKKNRHLEGLIATGGTVDAWSTLANEDLLDSYAASPILPMTCASAPCSPYATCTDVQGTARCVCKHGFEGDGKICKDIDECIFSPCGPASVCVNTVGSYQCKCRKGFQQTQDACIDIDECALGLQKLIPPPCPLQARCYNFSGTFDCICPHGTVWNGLSGPAAQCLRINSPTRGPCAGNGGCGANALCQALFTAAQATRKCGCVNGFKSLRIGKQDIAAAMASSKMSSFDNTVCIREDILPEEQAYYLISMHRERLRLLQGVPDGQLAARLNLPTNGQSQARFRVAFNPRETTDSSGSEHLSNYMPSPLASGHMSQIRTAAEPIPATPRGPDARIPQAGFPPHGVQMPASANLIPSAGTYPERQAAMSLTRGSCLLGVCFR